MSGKKLTSKQLISIIKQGTSLLKEHPKTTYSQKKIVEKLKWIGEEYTISSPFLNKVIKQEEGSKKYLVKAAQGIQELIRRELSHGYDFEKTQYVPLNSGTATTTVNPPTGTITSDKSVVNIYSNGRLSILKKVNFFMDAQEEVIFMGVRLKRFAGYLIGRQDNEFKVPLMKLLKQGVMIRCYLLDPDWEHTTTYFEDRSVGIPIEKKSPNEIADVIEEIRYGLKDIEKEEWGKNFELYTYAHFPQGYYLAVDGSTDNGKLHFAPYLFGMLRKDVPVVEVKKVNETILFEKLWSSLNKIRSDAKLISL